MHPLSHATTAKDTMACENRNKLHTIPSPVVVSLVPRPTPSSKAGNEFALFNAHHLSPSWVCGQSVKL